MNGLSRCSLSMYTESGMSDVISSVSMSEGSPLMRSMFIFLYQRLSRESLDMPQVSMSCARPAESVISVMPELMESVPLSSSALKRSLYALYRLSSSCISISLTLSSESLSFIRLFLSGMENRVIFFFSLSLLSESRGPYAAWAGRTSRAVASSIIILFISGL